MNMVSLVGSVAEIHAGEGLGDSVPWVLVALHVPMNVAPTELIRAITEDPRLVSRLVEDIAEGDTVAIEGRLVPRAGHHVHIGDVTLVAKAAHPVLFVH